MGQRLSTLLNSVGDVMVRSPRHLAENVPCGRLCWRCCFVMCCVFCCPCTCFILCRGFIRWFRARYFKTKQEGDEVLQPGNNVLHDNDDDGEIDVESPVEPSAAEPLSPGICTKLHNHNNYLFFMNKLKSEPRGDFIDRIHADWWGDYSRLESHHGFIQWLFPLPEPGVNSQAQTLQQHEIEKITVSDEAKQRLLKSYEMMLDFYGIKLVDKETGKVERSDNWKKRFDNLNWNTHNNLRISRILHCLGLLGFEHLKYPLIEFFLREIILNETLTSCKRSCLDYWMSTLDSDSYDKIQKYVIQLQDEARYLKQEATSRTRTRQLASRNTTQHTGNTWDYNWGEVGTSQRNSLSGSKKSDGIGDMIRQQSDLVSEDSDGKKSSGRDDGGEVNTGRGDGGKVNTGRGDRGDGGKVNSLTEISQLTSQPARDKLVKSSELKDGSDIKTAAAEGRGVGAVGGGAGGGGDESSDATQSTTAATHKLEDRADNEQELKTVIESLSESETTVEQMERVDTDRLTTADRQTLDNITQHLLDIQKQTEPTIQLQQSEPTIQTQAEPTIQLQQSEPTIQTQAEPTIQLQQSEPTIQTQAEHTIQLQQSEPTIQTQAEHTIQLQQSEPTIQTQAEPTIQLQQSEPTIQTQAEHTIQLQQSEPTIQTQAEHTIQLQQSEPTIQTQAEHTIQLQQSEPTIQTQAEHTIQLQQSEPTIQTQAEHTIQLQQSEPTIQTQAEHTIQLQQSEPTIQTQAEPTIQSQQSEPTLHSQNEVQLQCEVDSCNLATLDETDASTTHTKQIEHGNISEQQDDVYVTSADNENRMANVKTYQESLLAETDNVPVEADNLENVVTAERTELNATNIDRVDNKPTSGD